MSKKTYWKNLIFLPLVTLFFAFTGCQGMGAMIGKQSAS